MKIDLRPLLFAAALPVVLGSPPVALADDDGHRPVGLVKTVLEAAGRYRDPSRAIDDGYVPLPSCVTGPEEGAMGVHLVNEGLLVDGMLDATQPELIVYEPRPDGSLRLVAVEYLVFAEAWDAANDGPPVLEGQHFHFIDAPNRLGLPALYELHVWAFKQNPHGMFTDWNPRVTCEHFDPAM
jgi:hypothetical protein